MFVIASGERGALTAFGCLLIGVDQGEEVGGLGIYVAAGVDDALHVELLDVGAQQREQIRDCLARLLSQAGDFVGAQVVHDGTGDGVDDGRVDVRKRREQLLEVLERDAIETDGSLESTRQRRPGQHREQRAEEC